MYGFPITGSRKITRKDIGTPCIALYKGQLFPSLIGRFPDTSRYMLAFPPNPEWLYVFEEEKAGDLTMLTFGKKGSLDILLGAAPVALYTEVSTIAKGFLSQMEQHREAYLQAGIALEDYINGA